MACLPLVVVAVNVDVVIVAAVVIVAVTGAAVVADVVVSTDFFVRFCASKVKKR